MLVKKKGDFSNRSNVITLSFPQSFKIIPKKLALFVDTIHDTVHDTATVKRN